METVSTPSLFQHELDQIQQIDAGRRAARENRPESDLSTADKAILDDFMAGRVKFSELPLAVQFHVADRAESSRLQDPYRYSCLPERLSLQLWTPHDGLLLLIGLDPVGALVDWTWENYVGASMRDQPRVRNATPLTESDLYYSTPVREDWTEQITEAQRTLREDRTGLVAAQIERLEEEISTWQRYQQDPEVIAKSKTLDACSGLLSRLALRWNSTDHDPEKRQPPSYFIRWAGTQGFRPLWLDWAIRANLVDAHDGVYRAPYFDPDAQDYPVLLHVAVCAWEFARSTSGGTPKQRIERFLAERYPEIKATTRDLVAQLANWQRTGGRPKN